MNPYDLFHEPLESIWLAYQTYKNPNCSDIYILKDKNHCDLQIDSLSELFALPLSPPLCCQEKQGSRSHWSTWRGRQAPPHRNGNWATGEQWEVLLEFYQALCFRLPFSNGNLPYPSSFPHPPLCLYEAVATPPLLQQACSNLRLTHPPTHGQFALPRQETNGVNASEKSLITLQNLNGYES